MTEYLVPYASAESEFEEKRSRFISHVFLAETESEARARIDKLLDKGTRRVTIHLPYDKGGLLDMLYREAKVESVEYGETIDIVATCVPRVIGQVKDYIEGYREPKEDWEE